LLGVLLAAALAGAEARLTGAAFLAVVAWPCLLAISVAPFEVLIGRRRGRVRAG
jgi:hypothetical protein